MRKIYQWIPLQHITLMATNFEPWITTEREQMPWNIFFCGATVHVEPRPPRVEVFRTQIRHTQTHTVGLLWTSQPVAEAATCITQKRETKTHPFSGIRTSEPRNQATSDLCLEWYGHWCRPIIYRRVLIYCGKQTIHIIAYRGLDLIWYQHAVYSLKSVENRVTV